MLKCTCKFDFSDVDAAIKDIKTTVNQKMEEVGAESVDYAVQNGSYQDQTGYLRSRNKSEVKDDQLVIENDAEYASYVEAKGYEVISGAALYAEKRLKEIFE